MYNREFTPERITELKPNEIYVFGSNLVGSHDGGAARLAYNRFGAIWGQGVGLQGQSYAIPTMQGGVETIKPYVDEFIEFALCHYKYRFYVTYLNYGMAKIKDEEMALLLENAMDVNNIIMPKKYVELFRFFEKQGNDWVIIENNGRIVKELGPLEAEIQLSVLVVKKNNLFGLLNLKGEKVVPCEYRSIDIRSSNKWLDTNVLELIDQQGKHWLADNNGRIVTTRGYTQFGIGNPGKYRRSDETWNGVIGLWDYDEQSKQQGEGLFDMVHAREILPVMYGYSTLDIEEFDGIYSIGIPVYHHENGQTHCKLIDVKGHDLIPFEKGYSSIGVPSEHDYHIRAKKDGKWGYINIDDCVKIPFKYDIAYEFEKGYAIVGYTDADGFNHHYGVIGHHDRLVIPFVFQYPPELKVTDDTVIAKGMAKGQNVEYVWKNASK